MRAGGVLVAVKLGASKRKGVNEGRSLAPRSFFWRRTDAVGLRRVAAQGGGSGGDSAAVISRTARREGTPTRCGACCHAASGPSTTADDAASVTGER